MTKTRCVLYCRVSTDEQATKGYSIREQERELLAFAAREGYEVAAVVGDEGISGTTDSPDRPGLREVMALAETGQIDVVLTKRRDRLFRSRLFRLMCEQDLAEYGVKLRSMDDTGNAIGDAVLDTLAEEEIRVIVERTRAGRFGRARKGKVLGVGGNARAPFGFGYTTDRSGLTVDEAEMSTVGRVFHAVGVEGKSLWKTCRDLEASGVPAPKGGKRWHENTIRRWINSDLYLPHTSDEVATRVSAEVAAGLDEDVLFGLWCYGQRRVSKASGKAKREGKRRRYQKAPAEDIVVVPYP